MIKEIKLDGQQIVKAVQTADALSRFQVRFLPKTALIIARNVKAIRGEYETVVEKQKEIIDRYGGEWVGDEGSKKLTYPDKEKEKESDADIAETMETELDIRAMQVPVDSVLKGDDDIAYAVIDAFEWMFEDLE